MPVKSPAAILAPLFFNVLLCITARTGLVLVHGAGDALDRFYDLVLRSKKETDIE